MITSSPSLVRWMSFSTVSERCSRASLIAARVFSGAAPDEPRCATTSGPDDGWRGVRRTGDGGERDTVARQGEQRRRGGALQRASWSVSRDGSGSAGGAAAPDAVRARTAT